jgi:hypothetical protein
MPGVSVDEAREIRFLWPDGSEMTTIEVSALDDFVVLSPAGDSDDWVLYTNISCPHDPDCGPPFITSGVLLNP